MTLAGTSFPQRIAPSIFAVDFFVRSALRPCDAADSIIRRLPAAFRKAPVLFRVPLRKPE